MSLKLLQGKQLLDLQERVDDDIAELARAKPCRHCGGRLHQANYTRQPRGLPGLPVVDDVGRVIGFISRSDVLRAALRDAGLDVWS